MSWKNDKAWADKFMPEIKQILGLHLIGEPPIEEDAERNTDLIVLKMAAVRIAVRIRQKKYEDAYGDQFTIRAARPSGNKTELAKIIEGWGDYMFYGFADEESGRLSSWRLISLNEFRIWHSAYLVNNRGILPGIRRSNTDNSSSFYAFRAKDMPRAIVAEKVINETNSDRRQHDRNPSPSGVRAGTSAVLAANATG